MANKIIKPKDLIDFEKDIKKIYEKGLIKAPIHLSGNNEKQLIKIFKKIKTKDWVFQLGEITIMHFFMVSNLIG